MGRASWPRLIRIRKKEKYPERREIVDALPYTAAGKIRQNLLREQIAERIAHETAG
jgi:acyl-CoA synthetase (AMP-forming)/AMP-acid ligase II